MTGTLSMTENLEKICALSSSTLNLLLILQRGSLFIQFIVLYVVNIAMLFNLNGLLGRK